MALSVASGSFLSATSIGNFAVTGVGFQGTVLLLFGGRLATGLGTHAHADIATGVALSSTSRGCCGGHADDAAATSNTSRTQMHDRVYREVNGDEATVIDLDFVSWDADGFTLNQVTANATASRIFYLVLGGSEISNSKIGFFDNGAASGNLAVTGVGFQPDLVLFMSSEHFRTSPTSEGNWASMAWAMGAARSATERWTVGTAANTGSSVPDGNRILRSNLCLLLPDPSTTNPSLQLDFVSMDADGFTVNRQAVNDGGVIYLALKGTYQAKLGTLLQKTSTGTQAYTGVGFTPTAALFATVSRVVSATIAFGGGNGGLGVALSPTNRRALVAAMANVDPSACDTYGSESVALAHLTAGTPVVNAEATLASFDADGFTLDWTTADATARESTYLALASAAITEVGAGSLLLLGVS